MDIDQRVFDVRWNKGDTLLMHLVRLVYCGLVNEISQCYTAGRKSV